MTGESNAAAAEAIRVLIVCDVCVYRDGLASMLARCPRLAVVGKAEDWARALDFGTLPEGEPVPDVVLLDVRSADVAASVGALRTRFSGVQVIGLSVADDEEELLAHAEVGVVGFVTVGASFAELVATIESVARGEALCSPSLSGALLRRLAERVRQRPSPAPLPRLTSRELEVVALIDAGLSNKQIAQRLRIELPTVKNHVHHILDKLGASRRGEAAALVRAGRM